MAQDGGDADDPRQIVGEELRRLLTEHPDLAEYLEFTNTVMLEAQADLDAGDLAGQLATDDMLGILLRGHLWVERELIAMVQDRLPATTLMDSNIEFRHRQWIELAVGLEALPAEWAPAYRQLNTLRNRAAHDWGRGVTENDVTVLIAKIPGGLTTVIGVGEDPAADLRVAISILLMALKTGRTKMGFPEWPEDLVVPAD